MIKLKLTDILEKLSKSELRKFSDYVKSPYFNKSKNLVKLLEYYKKNYKDFDKENLTKEKVFGKIFPGKEYNDDIFRNMNSDLLNLAENYLAQIKFDNDHVSVKLNLLNELNARGIFSLFESNFEDAKEILSRYQNKSNAFYLDNYMLYLEKEFYNISVNKFNKEDTGITENNLICFFIIGILDRYSFISSRKNISDFDYKHSIEKKLLDELLRLIPEEEYYIRIYYNDYKLRSANEEKYFISLKELNEKYGDKVNKQMQYNNYISLINYLRNNFSANDFKSNLEIFSMRKNIIEKQLATFENKIDYSFYINAVKSGLMAGEAEWVFEFINSHKDYLIAKYRTSVFELCLAMYYFELKEYEVSLSHLAKVNYDLNVFYFEVKVLTAKIYWELNEDELLENTIEALRLYILKNKKLNPGIYGKYSDFMVCVSKLLKVKTEDKYHKLAPLKKEIGKNDNLYKIWLLEKISQMSVKK